MRAVRPIQRLAHFVGILNVYHTIDIAVLELNGDGHGDGVSAVITQHFGGEGAGFGVVFDVDRFFRHRNGLDLLCGIVGIGGFHNTCPTIYPFLRTVIKFNFGNRCRSSINGICHLAVGGESNLLARVGRSCWIHCKLNGFGISGAG